MWATSDFGRRSEAAAAAKSLQSCPTLCDLIDGSSLGSPRPWDSPGKNTGVGCHFLSNAWKWKVKVKSCPTLSDPMDCSLPDSSVHGIFQAIKGNQSFVQLLTVYTLGKVTCFQWLLISVSVSDFKPFSKGRFWWGLSGCGRTSARAGESVMCKCRAGLELGQFREEAIGWVRMDITHSPSVSVWVMSVCERGWCG